MKSTVKYILKKVAKYIFKLLSEGMTETEAVEKAAVHFHIPKEAARCAVRLFH